MRLKPLKYREFIARLRKLGLEGPLSGGKHPYFLHGNLRITIPNPHRGEVHQDIIKKVLDKIGTTAEEFFGG